ncbi:hypothetical protein KEJ18_04160 [Candidatus Bathyarchaeota archaeon]|nr:hypothetical protein [Candidatus Bathyarchaeota archaeon]
MTNGASNYCNVLMEAVMRDPDLGEHAWQETFIGKARGNALFQRTMKEYVLSDVAQALGTIHDLAINSAKKMAVGRNLILVIQTTSPKVRFYLSKRGTAWRINDGPPLQTPEHFETVDISVNYEYGYDALFSLAYLEDVPFNVIERVVKDASQMLEEKLTSDIVSLYEGISSSDLAGGAEISADTSGKLTWADLVEAWTAVRKAGYTPDIAMVHPDQVADLWNDDKFIHSFYFGNNVDVSRGILGETYLGFRIVETDLCSATKVHLIDTTKAAACLLRNDILIQPYEERLNQGVICTIRYGLGTLRKDAVARIVDC